MEYPRIMGPVGIPLEYLGIRIPSFSFGIPTVHLCSSDKTIQSGINRFDNLKSKYTATTAKIIEILWGADVKARWASIVVPAIGLFRSHTCNRCDSLAEISCY